MSTAAPVPAARRPAPKRRAAEPSVLFDAPGPRARRRNALLTVVGSLVILGILAAIVWRLADKDQFAGKLWSPFLKGSTWTKYILPGLGHTLSAALVAAVLALAFGILFGIGRMSDHAWLRVPSAVVIEFFRAIPLLLLMYFVFSGPATISDGLNREPPHVTEFMAVVVGLMLYNGSVLAEIFRAGIQSLPRGQSEAAYALGLRKNAVMRLILVPQAVTVMLPAIISQLVVLLKDTALGYIIGYTELLNYGFKQIPANYGNLLPAAIVIAVIYIGLNMTISAVATWLERRLRHSRKRAAGTVDTTATQLPGGAATGAD
ncbi:amino acid ABC transporter permease [Actinomadura parmotrematis]|uniref:Amino acid ABC transporter permease n=1 Tax=Actinomadura parmotrematis TaxID=2864039 RepID=A0ABS7FTE8_9ACTN|nr:amino acid ABC transporter permease [Actinomadura parmotrematis]MBW8483586.1 amino acid ABC transporter permease [Actinomadura parmotrematis]